MSIDSLRYKLLRFTSSIIVLLSSSFLYGQLGIHVEPSQAVLFGEDTLGPGVKAFWLPSKAAFRAGISDKESWDYDSIGFASMASGENCRAIGNRTHSWGLENHARGATSTSWGHGNQALGDGSTSWGSENIAMGEGATVWGLSNQASGLWSTTWGLHNEAMGLDATVWGQANHADSLGATVWGLQNKGQGLYATVWGDDNVARGSLGTTAGWNNISQSVVETVIGYFADTVQGANPLDFEDDDHLFVVGNGDFSQRSNALALFKNGDLKVGRLLELKAFDSPWGTETDDGVIASDLDHANSDLHLVANDNIQIDLDDFGTHTSTFTIRNGANQEIFRLDEAGNLDIAGSLNGASNHADANSSPKDALLVQLEDENKLLRKENAEIKLLLESLNRRVDNLENK